MRGSDERTAAVRERMAALERESRRRHGMRIAGASAAACLALVVALALCMPEWAGSLADVEGGNLRAASLFSGSGALGYLVIGIAAFLLGVSVTVLCFLLRKRLRDGDDAP